MDEELINELEEKEYLINKLENDIVLLERELEGVNNELNEITTDAENLVEENQKLDALSVVDSERIEELEQDLETLQEELESLQEEYDNKEIISPITLKK